METTSKVGTFIPIAGILIGAVGLVVGIIAITKANAVKSELTTSVTDLTTRVDSMETTVRAASENATRAQNQTSATRADTQRAFDQVGTELTTIRTQINKLTLDLQQLANRTPAPSGPATAGAVRTGSAGGTPGQRAADGTYTIQAGDTFTKIAARFGLSADDITRANPGVDARRLRVGQTIRIPNPPAPSGGSPGTTTPAPRPTP